jgi:hypothetical protein
MHLHPAFVRGPLKSNPYPERRGYHSPPFFFACASNESSLASLPRGNGKSQSAVLIAWPHADTDWAERLGEVEETYIALVAAITDSSRC